MRKFIFRFAVIFSLIFICPFISSRASGDEAPPGLALTGQPTPCPVSDKILFLSDAAGSADLWMMDRATGKCFLFLNWPESTERFPEWSPTCDRIFFKSTRGVIVEDRWSHWTISPDGRNPQPSTSPLSEFVSPTATHFSTDFNKLRVAPSPKGVLFSYEVDGTLAIFRSDVDGGNKKQITFPNGTADFDPRWDPFYDGIVFMRDEEIWSHNSSGEEKKLLRLSALPTLKGDVNYDSCVDSEDDNVLLEDLSGSLPHDWAHDINADGFVNDHDLDALRGYYNNPDGKPCH